MFQFYNLVAPFKKHILVMFLVALVSAMDMTLKPYCIKWIVDIVVNLGDSCSIWDAVWYPMMGYLLLSVLIFIAYRSLGYVSEIRMVPALRQHVCLWGVDQLMKRPYPFFQQHFAGALSQKIQDVVSSVPDFLEMALGRFLVVGLAIIIGTVALMQANIIFGLIMLVWTIIFLAVCWWATPLLARLASEWAHVGATVNGTIVDWITNSASVIIFGRHHYEHERIKHASDRAIEAEHKQQWANFWVATVLAVWTVLMIVCTLILLVEYREQQLISAGDFALVLTINTVLIHQVWQINGDCARFARLWGRIKQGMDSLQADDIPYAHNQKILSYASRSIDINNVSFQYEGAESPILHDVSLSIPSGQKVGIVGYSGAGKSTLIHILLRLFEHQKGTLSACGHKANDVSDNEWRSMMGFIPQDPSLFHRSLMDNIRYGRLDATDNEVIEAAKQARAHDFITKIPDGYGALVGERGVKLSGGQRQRIAIARTILRNAPILILDEATSQLDSVTESDIQDSLWAVMQEKTTLVVAHRLSTLLRMDRIIVLDAGRVAEDGTHHELLEQNGLYAALWSAQVGDFLGDQSS